MALEKTRAEEPPTISQDWKRGFFRFGQKAAGRGAPQPAGAYKGDDRRTLRFKERGNVVKGDLAWKELYIHAAR